MTEPVSYASVGVQQARNRAALWAMVLGIVGLVLAPVAVGGVLGVIALVMGIVAVNRPGKKGAAVTGIVLGACALPVAFVALFFWVGVGMALTVTIPQARLRATQANLANMKSALDAFEIDNGRYPTTAEGSNALVVCPADLAVTWQGPYLSRAPVDTWGHLLVYRGPEATKSGAMELLSVGSDGVEGTKDDVALPKGP
jgi:general secretion pathway protein G